MCNLEHRILLYNQSAARILSIRDALGLGRSLFGVLTSEPILQTLELLRESSPGRREPGPPRRTTGPSRTPTGSSAPPSTSARCWRPG